MLNHYLLLLLLCLLCNIGQASKYLPEALNTFADRFHELYHVKTSRSYHENINNFGELDPEKYGKFTESFNRINEFRYYNDEKEMDNSLNEILRSETSIQSDDNEESSDTESEKKPLTKSTAQYKTSKERDVLRASVLAKTKCLPSTEASQLVQKAREMTTKRNGRHLKYYNDDAAMDKQITHRIKEVTESSDIQEFVALARKLKNEKKYDGDDGMAKALRKILGHQELYNFEQIVRNSRWTVTFVNAVRTRNKYVVARLLHPGAENEDLLEFPDAMRTTRTTMKLAYRLERFTILAGRLEPYLDEMRRVGFEKNCVHKWGKYALQMLQLALPNYVVPVNFERCGVDIVTVHC